MKFILVALAFSTAVSAGCWPSFACHNGGNPTCDGVCKRQGNPKGGRCLPRDGCPGSDICACFPRKRSADIIDGDEALRSNPALFAEIFAEHLSPAPEPEKRSEEVEERAEEIEERSLFERDMEAAIALGRRTDIDARSICCSAVPPFSGACCEAHCDHIGKHGGQCSVQNVCTCNQ
ncbi:hypothetical protein QQS21_000265 [Conoideocrella luteorostrata]|uniref:Invertebrate defensins family profile domain-containing protein n=1 Tax=Conoideocrella luteorostrata TaxID=1105319 RepID=A0AAJ0D1D7_9HYPO|nr:hypothetical protein QQS21_000265 [Conoideocrella luteorostrata]